MGISLSNDEILGIGFFALVFLGVVFAFIDNRRERADRDKPLPIETVFRASLGMRLFMAVIAFVCIAGYPLMYASGIFGNGSAMTTETRFLFGLLEMFGIAVGIPLFYAAGPNDFFLDIERRTYRHVYGWPFRPRIREGSWEEMAGVYVWCRQKNLQYIVGISWKHLRRHSPFLGMFSGPHRADRWAQGVAATLGLPLVEPPPPRKQCAANR